MVRLAAWTPWGKNEPFSHFCNISLSQCTLRLGVTDLGLTGLALSRSLFPLSEMPAVHLLLQHGDTAPFPCSLEALLPDPSAAVETGSPLPALPQAAAAQSHRLPTGQICTQHLLISSLGPSLQLLSLDHCNQSQPLTQSSGTTVLPAGSAAGMRSVPGLGALWQAQTSWGLPALWKG